MPPTLIFRVPFEGEIRVEFHELDDFASIRRFSEWLEQNPRALEEAFDRAVAKHAERIARGAVSPPHTQEPPTSPDA
ncbi:MAG: hypothetical protein ACRDKU_07165 [Gaiellaceae bacterium]